MELAPFGFKSTSVLEEIFLIQYYRYMVRRRLFSAQYKARLSDKFMDLGNLIIGGLVIGQFISGKEFSSDLFLAGILIAILCYIISYQVGN